MQFLNKASNTQTLHEKSTRNIIPEVENSPNKDNLLESRCVLSSAKSVQPEEMSNPNDYESNTSLRKDLQNIKRESNRSIDMLHNRPIMEK